VIAWLATKGTAWMVRRSTDLVPHLLAMAARELLGPAAQPGAARRVRQPSAGVSGEPGDQVPQVRERVG